MYLASTNNALRPLRDGHSWQRFRRETGLEMPAKVDFDSPAFRTWVNWRYDVLMQVWRRVVEAVKEALVDLEAVLDRGQENDDREAVPPVVHRHPALAERQFDLPT